jgi:BON domain
MEGDQFMRRYQKWLSVGLLALTPGITLAGPFSNKKGTPATPQVAAPAARRTSGSNQEVAEKIKQALLKARLAGYEIQIDFVNGVATLNGMVSSPDQKLAATKACSSIKGVTRVENRLAVAEPMSRGGVQQAAASQSRAARAQRVRPANFQPGYEGQEPAQMPAEGVLQPEAMSAMPPSGGPPGYGPAAYAPQSGGASHVIYNQPGLPNNAWPSYAQYPNYAAVSYPSQYAASAWPYIGPFYPYPQVPMGWRKATLEWDDGNWNLSFSPRTDRWWWFLDWKNW